MTDLTRLPSQVHHLAKQLLDAVELVAPDADLRLRAMFGGAGAYAQAGMFASLSHAGLALKLPPDAQAELLARPEAERLRYEADATPSRHYIVVPPSVRADATLLTPWVRRSIDHVATLPPPKRRPDATRDRP